MKPDDRQIMAVQNAAFAYLEFAECQQALDDAKAALYRAKNEMTRSGALKRDESRVVPTAPGEFVVVKCEGRDNYEFTQALTNVLADYPEQRG